MPVYSRSFSSRLFAVIGTAALATALAVAATGGFLFHIGPLRVSAHGVLNPLLAGAVAWIIVRLHGRAEAHAAAALVLGFVPAVFAWVPGALSRHAAAVAVVLAAMTAGIGTAYGTYSAAATDPSGYVSQSALLAEGQVSLRQPLSLTVPWPKAQQAFEPLGYRSSVEPGAYVPLYPPGLPAVMAAARAVGGESAGYVVIPLLAALLVLATYGIGRRLHSPLAGVLGAALVTTSPAVLFHITHPMSDVPAAAWWTLATVGALSHRRGSALGAGVAAGLAILTRPNLAPLAAPVALLALVWPRANGPGGWAVRTPKHVGRCAVFVLGVASLLGALLAWQRLLYGSVFETGYGKAEEFFAAANIGPNITAYAGRIVRGELPALCLTAALVAALAWFGWFARLGRFARSAEAQSLTSPGAMRRLAPPALVAAAFAAAVLTLYLPYGVFADWAYVRFLLPAFPAAFVLVGALAAEVVATGRAAGAVVTVAVLAACLANVQAADREQVFRLYLNESRFRTAGRYIDSATPRDTVILTMQHSGSVRYYTGLPIVRWDLLAVDADLELVLADLRARGRRGLLLVEEWEVPLFRARFPSSPIARLDWPPRAEFGHDVRVWLYDPDDRLRPTAAYATDRLP
jgi:4-amino-4-deoxy-L-arabinose transferase-like glycosyltransferase